MLKQLALILCIRDGATLQAILRTGKLSSAGVSKTEVSRCILGWAANQVEALTTSDAAPSMNLSSDRLGPQQPQPQLMAPADLHAGTTQAAPGHPLLGDGYGRLAMRVAHAERGNLLKLIVALKEAILTHTAAGDAAVEAGAAADSEMNAVVERAETRHKAAVKRLKAAVSRAQMERAGSAGEEQGGATRANDHVGRGGENGKQKKATGSAEEIVQVD